jgi:sugar/nucleoside kinase (ribokinase family)
MKDIELCGIGNALVDLQYNASYKELEKLKLRKGEMKLVSPEEQTQILIKLAGEGHYKSSGGSAANTIIAFSAFGGSAAYKTVLGKDNFGDFYLNEFKKLGIELHTEQLEDMPTGTCVVLITPDSERTMHTCLAATSQFTSKHISKELIDRSQWLYLEGYKFSEPDSTKAIYEAMEHALKSDTKISVTFSDTFITDIFREQVAAVVEKSDLLFCNEDELKSFTQEQDFDLALAKLDNLAKNYAVTKGKEGSIVKWNGERFNIQPYHATPVDTTGAGDMYAGGFLYGLIKTGNPMVAGHLGSKAAARIVSQYGARLNESHEALKNSIFKVFNV